MHKICNLEYLMKNSIQRIIIILFGLWGIFFQTVSANASYYFNQLTIDKGLSQATVTCILSGSDGMMWIGTRSGLNVYDRHEMRSFFYDKDRKNSLPGNYIYFITEDSAGTIWVSTNKGLVRYDRSDNSFYPAIPGKVVMSYSYCLKSDAIYFGGANTLYKYTTEQKKWEQYPLETEKNTPSNISFIIPKDDYLLLISSKWQTFKFSTKRHSYELIHFLDTKNMVSGIYQDKKENLYIAPFSAGLYCYDKNLKLKFHLNAENSKLTNDFILSIIEKDGKLWLATDGGGIFILDPDDMSINTIRHIPGDPTSMPVNSITCLYKDPQNNVFAGSVRGGMFSIKEVPIKTYPDASFHSPYGLSERAVIALYEDYDGILWIGTDGGGVNSYDPKTDRFTHYNSLKQEKVVAITRFSESELLVSLYNNTPYIFNKRTGNCKPFEIISPQITTEQCKMDYTEMAFRLSEKKIYFLSSIPYIYHTDKHTFSQLKTSEDPSFLEALNPIFADEKEAYLIGNRGHRLFKVDQEAETLNTMLYIGDNEIIRTACKDGNGDFWIGTDDGLSCYNPKNKVLKKVETELFNNVSALLYDGVGRLWIGAQNMLFSYEISSGKFVIWGESDGFSPNEIPHAYQRVPCFNNIYLCGVAGLVRIDRSISSQDEPLPIIKLMDVVVDGNSLLDKISSGDTVINVPWSYSSLAIKVVSIEKDIFRKKLFRYVISGPNNLNAVTYSHIMTLQTLPPGKYTIEVSCNTKNGDWSTVQKVLSLVVTPPWYKEPFYQFLMLFLACILLTIGVRLSIKRRERKMKWEMSIHEQKISEDKVRFLINVSHELRTPLTLAYAPLKRMIDKREWELPNHNFTSNLLNIFRQIRHMKDLINMVLDISKITDEENVLHKTLHSVNNWIEEVASDFRMELKEKRIGLTFDFDTANPILSFDLLKCTSVLSNLLMNALKFSESETTITITSRIIGNKVRISVADQGIGLDNVDTDMLFVRYYQSEHQKTGTGIGLSYAKMLIEKHGGTIGVMPNNPQGAIFYFELPYDPDTMSQQISQLDKKEEELLPIIDTTKDEDTFPTINYSVMVVEDNEELRTFIKQSLQGLFKHVYTASDGYQALTVIRDKLPDIVVSDVMMPRMDGFEMCRKIKEDMATSHIPVILLTARGDSGSMHIGYKQGADTYLSKPFEEELLLTIIINQLKSREALKKKYIESGFANPLSLPENANNLDEEFLFKLNKLINDNICQQSLDVKFLTERMGMSRTPLFTKLKALTNMGINDYITMIRIEKASELLNNTQMSIVEISEAVSFNTPKYFSTLFKQIKGMTPTQYREAKSGVSSL